MLSIHTHYSIICPGIECDLVELVIDPTSPGARRPTTRGPIIIVADTVQYIMFYDDYGLILKVMRPSIL